MFPWKSKHLYPILLTSLSAVMGVSLISPVLPRIQEVLNLTDLQTGSIVTLYTLPAVPLALAAGPLIDRYGRRTVLVPSLMLFGGAGFSVSFINSFQPLILLRITQGIGATSLVLISRTLVGDLFEGNQQQSVMGLNDSILALGAAIYPFIGGYLGQQDWSLPFSLYLFPALIGILSAWMLRRVPIDNSSKVVSYPGGGISILGDVRTVLYLSLTFLSFLLLYSIQAVSPLYVNGRFGYGSGSIGVLLTLMAFAIAFVSLINGFLAKRIDNRWLVITGLGLYSVGLLLLGSSETYPGLLAGFLVFGAGHGLNLPCLNTLIVRLVETNKRGTLMSYRTVSVRIGQTLAPTIFPLIGQFVGYGMLFVSTGILLMVGVGLGTLVSQW